VVYVGDDGDVTDGFGGRGGAHFGYVLFCGLGWAQGIVKKGKLRVFFSLPQ
jgi:hypothetical protein